ncbi:MAG: hypothetical protein WBF90_18020 [Rivularia sp. (in: cyanobacteria)]
MSACKKQHRLTGLFELEHLQLNCNGFGLFSSVNFHHVLTAT